MTISITRTRCIELASAALAATVLLSSPAQAQDDTNASPHWNKGACQDCHVEATPVDGVVNLQAADSEALCETCHGGRGSAKACRHTSGLSARDMRVAESLAPALKNGKVVCSTCHDIVYQCKHARIEYSYQNPGFLRDRTTRRTGEFCLRCHEASAYEALSPHEGVAGDPPMATCPLCHVGIPESNGNSEVRVSFHMQYDLNEMCTGCHDVAPHPRNLFSRDHSNEWVHMVVPSADIAANLREAEAQQGIQLPLHPETGEIFCATCHNPHEFKGGPVPQQPEHRLRASDICQVCHDK